MKNKIIAFLLAVLTIATSFVLVIPAAAASDEEEAEEPRYSKAAEDALKNAYLSVEEKVNAEMEKEYTYLYAQNEKFSLYANKYTGEVYLKNRNTNQWLTTNPISLGSSNKGDQLSQIWISFTDLSGNAENYSSFAYAAEKGQISLRKIVNGIRVEYIIGENTSRYAAPEAITLRDFMDTFVSALQSNIMETVASIPEKAPTIVAQMELQGVTRADLAEMIYTGDYHDLDAFRTHITNKIGPILNPSKALQKAVTTLYGKIPKINGERDVESTEYQALLSELIALGVYPEETQTFGSLSPASKVRDWGGLLTEDFNTILQKYKGKVTIETASDKQKADHPILNEIDPVTGKNHVVYLLDPTYKVNQKRGVQALLTTLDPSYTLEDALEQERRATIVSVSPEQQPVFRCALEYTLDDTGMTYSLPSNSLVYDETKYILEEISVLRYFGANDAADEGYVFYPDGSGALFDNDVNVSITRRIYGHDYGYRMIDGQYNQPVRLPVYGAATTLKDGVRNGYFAVITEGDALTELTVAKLGSHLTVYQKYDPRPSDTYTMAQMTDEITIYSDVKYTGSYATKIYMLSDPAKSVLEESQGGTFFRADYVGMANAYRHYLVEEAKVLSKLDGSATQSRLPLYIESFGFLKTTEKFLTFPVEVDAPLTTFKDVERMYGELAGNNISNVKFRLSGFFNGGYEGNYPQRLKINKSVGGKDGYKALLKYAEKNEDKGMEVFLSVDLMYNYHPGKFGTPSQKKTLARSMDNRYASRQVYDTVYQGYFSRYSMVVSADKLEQLFNKFNKNLSKFKVDALALDYMASELSSNFNKEHLLDRESAKDSVAEALNTISTKYESIMSTGGNAYALKYVDYLLGAPIESSRYLAASRTVPFYGMVMHGYVQYAGGAFNEVGTPEYELLRAIESGASMYYILSYRNTDLIKEDFDLNKHYSVNYEIWKEDLIKYYNILDYAIGDLQTYMISDHKFLAGERIVSAEENAKNLAILEAEYLELLKDEINAEKQAKGAYIQALIIAGQALAEAADYESKLAVYASLADKIMGLNAEVAALINDRMLDEDGIPRLTAGEALYELIDDDIVSLEPGQALHITFDREAILADAAACFDRAVSEGFAEKLDALIAEHATAAGTHAVSISSVTDYESKTAYNFFTSSSGDDADYELTKYSLSDGSIVLVTYSNGIDTVELLLNFNIFDVKVKYNGEDHVLGKYDFIRIGGRDGVEDPRKGE